MLDWLQLVWRGAESRSEAPDDGERLCPSVGTQIRPLMDT